MQTQSRVIYDNRSFPVTSKRFIVTGMLMLGMGLLLVVLMGVQLARGQEVPATVKNNTLTVGGTDPRFIGVDPEIACLAVADRQDGRLRYPEGDTGCKKPYVAWRKAVPPPDPIPAPAAAATPTPTPSGRVDPCTQCKGKYCPTVIQCKDLQLAQKDAIIGIQNYNIRLAQEEVKWDEFAQRQASSSAMVAACRKVMDENHWPADTRCDPNTNPIVFVDKPATPPPAATTPPPTATPTPVAPAKTPAPTPSPVLKKPEKKVNH